MALALAEVLDAWRKGSSSKDYTGSLAALAMAFEPASPLHALPPASKQQGLPPVLSTQRSGCTERYPRGPCLMVKPTANPQTASPWQPGGTGCVETLAAMHALP